MTQELPGITFKEPSKKEKMRRFALLHHMGDSLAPGRLPGEDQREYSERRRFSKHVAGFRKCTPFKHSEFYDPDWKRKTSAYR